MNDGSNNDDRFEALHRAIKVNVEGLHDHLFRNEKMKGPAEFFAFEASMLICQQQLPEMLPNLGEQARICSDKGRYHTVIVRRPKDVVVFSCPDCSREDAIALTRAAVR
jgi:hypothetical protein